MHTFDLRLTVGGPKADHVRDKVREALADFASKHDLEFVHVSAAGPDGIEHLTVSMTDEPADDEAQE